MKINYSDYIKKTDVTVLIAEAIFSVLNQTCERKKIVEIADTTSGGTPLRGNAEYYNGNIPWLKSGELNDNFISCSEEFITQKGLDNSSAKLHPEGTLLIAMYGATTGKTGITKIKASTNQAVCAIFPKVGIERDYLYWFLRQYRYKFIEISKGGAQPNISQTVINQTTVPIPSLHIQKEIATVLTKIQDKGSLDLNVIPDEFKYTVNKVFHTKNSVSSIELENTHQLDLLKKIRQQILRDAVQGKLVPQDRNDEPTSKLLERIIAEKERLVKEKIIQKEKPLPEIRPEDIPNKIPENWVWCRLGEICFKITDGFHNTPPKIGNGVPYISATHVKSDGIVWENCDYVAENFHRELFLKAFPRKGELLVVNIGAGCGTPAIIDVDYEFSFKNTAILKFNQELIYNSFLFYYFLLSRESIYNTQTQGGLQPFLSLKILNDILLPVPPIEEQHRIVSKIKQLMKQCDDLDQSIQQNQKYTQELLQVALKEVLEPK
jgi:type I restriction enzyme S subunit